MPIVAPAEFAPDMPDLSEATNIAINCIALTPESYGPLHSLLPYTTNALDSAPLGMGFGEDSDLWHHHVFAGTQAKLWCLLNLTDTTWTDCTNPSGAYFAAGENWHFAQFKNLMLATDFYDPIQVYDMAHPATYLDLSPDAPHARFIAVAKNFVIVANTEDPVGGTNPARLWWSAFNDPTTWPVPGSALAQQTQSDYNDMNGPMGQITGLVPNLAGCDCGVFFERGVFRMIYVGPPDVFNFYPAFSVRGCPAPNSIVPLGNLVYFLGEDGFYVFDGSTAVPIGANKVDRWFFSLLDPAAFGLVIGAPDINSRSIVWAFRSPYVISANEQPNMVVIYRWDIQRWTYGILEVEWLARVPTGAAPIVPLTTGQLQLGAIDTNQKLAYFAAQPLQAQIGTKVAQITPNSRTFVSQTRPLVQVGFDHSARLIAQSGLTLATQSGLQFVTEAGTPAAITVALSARNTYYEAEVFGTDVAPDISGSCSTRSEGRYHRGRITITPGVWSTMAGLDINTAIPSGTR